VEYEYEMLTICYSLLTWIQGRKRAEVRVWVNETCVKEGQSLLVLRERIEAASFRPTECPWLESAGSSPSTTLTRGHWKPSYSRCVSLSSLRQPQTSPLCFNRELRTVRLLWEGHDTKALVISPYVYMIVIICSVLPILNFTLLISANC